MHPAPSVILFTTLSGLGFGLLFWLGVGDIKAVGWVGFVFYLIAFSLSVGGLLASTFHLGNPKNAMKAFTQWQTSWLSREAWCAVGALVLMGLYAFLAVFFSTQVALLGWLGALMCLATVFTTSMIYTQLKTIPRWNSWLTPLHLLSLSLAGGALLAGQVSLATGLLVVAGLIQLAAWAVGDRRLSERGHNLATATGLGSPGHVRAFEPPHTGSNFLLDEMVHVVGRKHSQKLRIIAFVLAFALPVLLLSLFYASHVVAAVAVLSHIAGVLVSRWLFFAEAEHVVGIYYGKR